MIVVELLPFQLEHSEFSCLWYREEKKSLKKYTNSITEQQRKLGTLITIYGLFAVMTGGRVEVIGDHCSEEYVVQQFQHETR